MYTTTLQWDQHPGQWHVGVNLFLCEVVITSFSDKELFDIFITGFRMPDTGCRGMYGDTSDPIQVLKIQDDKIEMSMSCYGKISRPEVSKLIKEGKLVLRKGPHVYTITVLSEDTNLVELQNNINNIYVENFGKVFK